jgi:hypothetical protein
MARFVPRALAASALLVPSAAWAQYGQTDPYAPEPQQSGLEAGGLTPPPSVPEEESQTPESAETKRDLEEAEDEDSGRGLEFVWLNAEIGFEHLDLQTFSADKLGIVDSSQTGALFGAGLGLRIVFITLGGRFRLANFSAYQIWTLDAEAGLRIPLGNLEPYFMLGGGYTSLGSFDAGNLGGGLNTDNVDITGYNIRFGGGLDYYVTPVFSIGAALNGEVIGLTRPGVDLGSIQASGSATGTEAEVAAADGSSLGFGVTGTLVLGLHF